MGLCNARFARGSSAIIPLINTHRHTVLKKYRLKYLILPGNSQGHGQIPGNPKKTYRNVPTAPQNEIEIQNRFATPKTGFENPNPNPKVKSGFENCVQYMESIFEIRIPRSNPVLKIPSQKTYRNVPTAPGV